MIVYDTIASQSAENGGSSGSNPGGGTGGSSVSTSPTSVVYATDPFKSNFNTGNKHGASLCKTATEAL